MEKVILARKKGILLSIILVNAIKLRVIVLNVFLVSIILLKAVLVNFTVVSVIMANVILLRVILVNAVAPVSSESGLLKVKNILLN
jgi:hypothetical protein